MNTATLGGKPILDPPVGNTAATNMFAMYTGASNYGVGAFLMNSTDYYALIKADTKNTGEVILVLQADGSPGISMNVILAGATPFVTGMVDLTGKLVNSQIQNGVGSSPNEILEVTVFDKRVLFTHPVTAAVNVQVQGFPQTNTSTPVLYSNTYTGSNAYTWQAALSSSTQGAMNLPDYIAIPTPIPTWNPRNLTYDGDPICRVVDDICGQLYLVAGYRWNNPGGTNDNVELYNPGQLNTNNSNLTNSSLGSIVGGEAWQRNPSRFPTGINVNFRVYNADDPTNPFPLAATNGFSAGNKVRDYTVSVTNSTGNTNSNFYLSISYGSYVGVLSGGAVVNSSELDTVGKDIAARALAAMKTKVGDVQYAGAWPFETDGAIRGILWKSDNEGCTTTIRYNDDRQFFFATEMKRAVDVVSNQLVKGMGTQQAAAGPSGSRYLWGTSSGKAVPVKATGDLLTGGEYYKGIVASGVPNFNSAANFDGSLLGTFNATTGSCTLVNVGSPPGISNHMWPVSSSNVYTYALPTGATDPNNNNDPVYAVNYTSDEYEVDLTQTGGSASTGYTYTVKNKNGETLLTAAAPSFRPLDVTIVNIATAATKGRVRFVSGTWVLVEAFEVFNFGACT